MRRIALTARSVGTRHTTQHIQRHTQRNMSGSAAAAPTAAAVASAPSSSSAAASSPAASSHVTVPKSSVDFFSEAAPRLHAYVRDLQAENAALRSQNAALRADADILDGISDFLRDMSKSDLNYAEFMKSKMKQVHDEKRAAANAGTAQTKQPLPPLKDVPPAAAAPAATAAAAPAASSSSAAPATKDPAASSHDACASPALSTAPPARSPRVRVSQKRPAAKPAGSGAHWTFTAASGSNPALRHLTPYHHEYASFAKTRWIGRSVLAVLCSDFKPPAAAATAEQDDAAEGTAAAAPTTSAASAAESYYRQAIASGRVLVNDSPVSSDYVLQSGDHMRQRVHRHEPPVPDFNAADDHCVRIISDTPDLLVVDKPSGIPVHESGKYFSQSLLGVLANQLPPGSPALLPVHRLDKLTSGVVLLAKNAATAARLGAIIKGEGDKDDESSSSRSSGSDEAAAPNGSSAAASAGQLRKVYVARVNGRFPASPADLPAAVAGVSPALTADGFLCLSAPLRVISARAGLHAVDFSSELAKPASTLFRALSYDARSDTSVVEVRPQTGRTHQIRAHLLHLRFPITNDPVYGGQLFEGNSYEPSGEGHPDPAVQTKQPGAWDASCADCVNQMYYKRAATAASQDAPTRYCTGIWLHALSYSFTPAASAAAPADSAASSDAAAAAAPSGFSFSTAPVDWADAHFDVVAALGKRVKATPKASDLLATAAASASAAASPSSSSAASSSTSFSPSASASPPPSTLRIRASLPSDLGAITRIYAHHVLHGTASFEEIPPTEAEMVARRNEVLSRGLPFLVATVDSEAASSESGSDSAPIVVGFAYANLFRLRTAYRFTVENSIYLDPGYCARRGVGAALLRPLLSQLQSAGYRQVLAVIGDSANAASIGLHSKFGFQHLGTMRRVGLKFGRWLDVVFMQLDLKQGDQSVPNSDPTPCVEQEQGR